MTASSPDTVHVFKTRVEGRNGAIHFDVMSTDQGTALRLARQYLTRIGEGAPR